MRVKTDFVTNSSSTSFVMYGYVVRNKYFLKTISRKKLKEEAKKFGYQLYDESDMQVLDDGTVLVGVVLAEVDSESEENFEEDEVDLGEVVKRVEKMKVDLGLPTEIKPKLICGLRIS